MSKTVYFQCPSNPAKIRSGFLLDTGKIKLERLDWRALGKEYIDSRNLPTFDTYEDCYIHVASLGPKNLIGSGMTSNCYLITENIVRKQYIIPQPHVISKEVECLERLNKLTDKHFPLLIGFSLGQLYIDMSHCGERATAANIPPDWKEQCDKIYSLLSSAKIFHRDINYNNILVRDGIINLVDFGNATINTDEIDRTRTLYTILHNENGRTNSNRRHR